MIKNKSSCIQIRNLQEYSILKIGKAVDLIRYKTRVLSPYFKVINKHPKKVCHHKLIMSNKHLFTWTNTVVGSATRLASPGQSQAYPRAEELA